MPERRIVTKFDIGQVIYHKLDNRKGLIGRIIVEESGYVYGVLWGSESNGHCAEYELSSKPVAIDLETGYASEDNDDHNETEC